MSANGTQTAGAMPPADNRVQTTAVYMFAAAFIALSQSLGQGFLSANISTLAGELGASVSDTTWLMVAFMAPRAALPLMLTKVRMQYGLRRFAEVSIVVYAAVAGISLFATDLRSALLVELLSESPLRRCPLWPSCICWSPCRSRTSCASACRLR